MKDELLEEKFVTTPRGQIFYYADLSFPGKRTVVFLHGLSSNHTTWVNIIQKIHDAGYNSIALDMRGHGKSDKRKHYANYKFSVFSEDLRQIIKKENLGKVILVGYSFGGNVALDFVGRNPEMLSGMVLISTNFIHPFKYKRLYLLRWILWPIMNLISILFLIQHRKQYRYFQHGESTGFWHSTWIGLNTMPFSINIWMFSLCAFMNFQHILPNISIPTVIVRATSDPYVTQHEAADMNRIIKGSKLIISQNPKHFLATHAQGEITEIILDFLKQCA